MFNALAFILVQCLFKYVRIPNPRFDERPRAYESADGFCTFSKETDKKYLVNLLNRFVLLHSDSHRSLMLQVQCGRKRFANEWTMGRERGNKRPENVLKIKSKTIIQRKKSFEAREDEKIIYCRRSITFITRVNKNTI